MMRRRVLAVALCLASVAVFSCRRGAERRTVTVVTTPYIAGTGIDRMLVDQFAARRKVRTNILVTEEQLIPDLVARGIADVVITRSQPLRAQLKRQRQVRITEVFAHEELVLVGPRRDPAKIRRAPTPAEAFRRIARRDRAFCSAVDSPSLREHEAVIWSTSRAKRSDNRRYRLCRGSVEDVLRESGKQGAYTLTWSHAFDAVRQKVPLVLLLEDTALRDDYTVLLIADPARNRNALWFVQWVMSSRARDLIATHRFDDGRRLLVRGDE